MADISTSSEGLIDPLTDREQEILVCMVEGLSNREIAECLHLAYRTVKWYNSQIYSKLGVNNRDDAVAQATRLGLVDSADETPLVETRHNLPSQTTPFIGRQQELDNLARLLGKPDTRIVTILAPGGMGKTRLGLTAVEQQYRHYADGVFFVSLAPLSSSHDIVTAIADNVGFSFYGSESPQQQLLNYFREREVLLLLDNFEHLLDGARLVTDILQAAPRIKVLATSREKLNLSGETIVALSGLHFPNWEKLEDALEYDAVKLFMQSARRVRPDFDLQAQDLDYLARICRLTGGMPLGIVLAAGWLDVLSLEQIAAEIQHGIGILETEQRDVPERQRSMRASFNYSWNRLADIERDIFMKLSVFRGGFTAEAAQVIAGTNLRQLRKLIDKALVGALPTGRYEVHELLRQYGEEELRQTDEADAVQQAHSAYYMDFMAEHDDDVKGRRQEAGLQEIRADFENIRRAWLWATQEQDYEAINRALDCLVNASEGNNSLADAYSLLQDTAQAMAASGTEEPHVVWDRVVLRCERIGFLLAHKIGHSLADAILERTRRRGDLFEVAYCLWTLGDHARRRNDRLSEAKWMRECVEIWDALNQSYYIAHALIGVGSALVLSEPQRSLEVFRESARIRRNLHDTNGLAFTLWVLALTTASLGTYSEAENYIDEALSLQHETKRTAAYASIASVKGELLLWQGEPQLALQYARMALGHSQAQNYLGGKSHALAVMSLLSVANGDYADAMSYCLQAKDGDLLSGIELRIDTGLALAHLGLGHPTDAGRYLMRSLRNNHHNVYDSAYFVLSLLVASILTSSGNCQRSAKLVGLVFHHNEYVAVQAFSWPLMVNLQRDLEAELGAEAYAAAWHQGAQLDLATAVEELLVEFGEGVSQ